MGGSARLARRLGLTDAVVLGMGAMLGAGVFAVLGPAAAVAGTAVLPALLVAGAIATANAMSSAWLAARHPESGGAYVYGRHRLGRTWGFLAGWAFVTGKIASCAAMALTLGAHAWPEHARAVAAAAVVAVVAVNLRGITRTAAATRVLLALTLAVLAAVVVAALSRPAVTTPWAGWGDAGPLAVLQAAGLLFFAFAGYARIATLGEEVRDPARTIPRAIPLALGLVLGVYALVALAALTAAGPAALAGSGAPLATAAGPGLAPLVRAGGAVASAGALLALVAGVGRTVLAMARDHELPGALAAVHPRFAVPHRAELAAGAAVLVVVLTAGPVTAIGLSAFAVLLYYAVANAAALTLHRDRPWRRVLSASGLVGCLVLAALLPPVALLAGGLVLVTGLLVRAVVRRGRDAGRRGKTTEIPPADP
ncbi:amino acid/polyamine/organocation transporter, APC superfamily [Pseudonocardia ammonioxydans]|uniref:Amino acid/polyamine/organocation transporter, APC superfamily n=1 Tax=Pseudonocardia ammonioxydans TaxID=260086 RepID=A0A1I5DJL5_PSUAM|nr:APC family permease [Pseudonocardia ammonioxydans]SFN98991.1 amino acid/polyamine/organocation transporter, APC superfamily [Pseudonocardia ammonioxydans]